MDLRTKLAGGFAGMVAAVPAFADAPDVAATVTEIGTYAAPIATIGLAVLAVVLVLKGTKWFRRAL